MLRFFAGALALVLILPNPASAKGYNIVRGKCLCIVGLAVHLKPKWTASCAHDCNAPEIRPDLRKDFEAERPKRQGPEFRAMWSQSASLPLIDVSSARRVRHGRWRDYNGRWHAYRVAYVGQRAGQANARRLAGAAVEGGFSGSQIVAHPAGCPRTAFCGCGVAVHVFGAPIRALWLAANWFRFPRAEPAPGMVAVRQHHVFAIERVLGNGMVMAYDPNSGGHLTRVHVRSLAGYRVVNPRSG